MFVIIGLVLGALLGAMRARKRGGNRADMALYATIHGIIFALLGLFITIAVERML